MQSTFRKLAIRSFGQLGIFPTLIRTNSEVLELIAKLRPVPIKTRLVRFGPSGDGGYLIPDDLDRVSACFSPGVSEQSGFEVQCADLGLAVYMADGSVEAPPVTNVRFKFIKKFLGAASSDDTVTLEDWVERSVGMEVKADLLLQMDIEGYEYEVILSTAPRILDRFRIIVVEFHHLHLLWSHPVFPFMSHAFEKLLKNHSCVHIHPNNYSVVFTKGELHIPEVMEFTFLRNDYVRKANTPLSFPHPLDIDNTPDRPPVVLPKCWRS